MIPCRCGALLHECAADDFLHDLRRAAVDAGGARVSEFSSDGLVSTGQRITQRSGGPGVTLGTIGHVFPELFGTENTTKSVER